MSKSYRHTPICGLAQSSSNLLFRSYENRRKRRRVNQVLHTQQYDRLPDDKEYGNEWDSPRDGKTWFGNLGSWLERCIPCRDIGYYKRYRFMLIYINQCTCKTLIKEYNELMRK